MLSNKKRPTFQELMESAMPSDFYSLAVEAQITAIGTAVTTNLQMPDDGFHIISLRAEAWSAATGQLTADKFDLDRITVKVQQQTSPNVQYTDLPLSILKLEELEQNNLWRGWFFPGHSRTKWTFNCTTYGGTLAAPIDVFIHMFGYQVA